jgi:hypothetical protein
LISFIHNLGLTIKPIKGPPQGVYACPHNKKLATLLNNKQCVCVCVCSPFPFPPLSTSNVLVSSLRQPVPTGRASCRPGFTATERVHSGNECFSKGAFCFVLLLGAPARPAPGAALPSSPNKTGLSPLWVSSSLALAGRFCCVLRMCPPERVRPPPLSALSALSKLGDLIGFGTYRKLACPAHTAPPQAPGHLCTAGRTLPGRQRCAICTRGGGALPPP